MGNAEMNSIVCYAQGSRYPIYTRGSLRAPGISKSLEDLHQEQPKSEKPPSFGKTLITTLAQLWHNTSIQPLHFDLHCLQPICTELPRLNPSNRGFQLFHSGLCLVSEEIAEDSLDELFKRVHIQA